MSSVIDSCSALARGFGRAHLVLGAFGALSLACTCGASAQFTDFRTWTLVQDPPNVLFTAQVNSASTITLEAISGPVPTAADIGFQSVNADTPALAGLGFCFDPANSFTVAVDYTLTRSAGSVGGLGIGFGIGEDADGSNGAGVALGTTDNLFLNGFGASARINDVDQTGEIIAPIFSLGPYAGSFFASYDAGTGTITLGIGAASASTPSQTVSYPGIQNQWNGTDLMVSVFMRSDDALGQAWTSGTATATFSNLRVTPGSVLPESKLAPVCQNADYASPFGLLDVFDADAYLALLLSDDPAAELDAAPGLDFFDAAAFLNAAEPCAD